MDYHRDEKEHYRIVLNDDGTQKLKVFDGTSGQEYPVDISSTLETQLTATGGSFLDVPYLNPVGDNIHREAFQLLPVKDSVLVLNRTFPTKRVIGDSDDDAEPTTTSYRKYKLVINTLNYKKIFGSSKVLTKEQDINKKYFSGYGYTINGRDYVYPATYSPQTVAARLAVKLSEDFAGFDAGVKDSTVFITVDPNVTISVQDRSAASSDIKGYSQRGRYDLKTITVSSEKFTVVTGITGRPAHEALLWVRQADYAVNYNVKVNGTVYNVKTPESTSDGARDGLRTESIAASLAVAVSNASGITAISNGNVVHVTSSSDFTLEANDSLGGTA
ncbi:phage nozzle protein [Marinobacter similis]|uniref:Uncharacterized protein n=1 Tax=Marinobacter similis TaxID=1420916 RepID=W5YMK9_9GAMM|nr:hypothetical protein [Marinobacter similis]AHI30275.1 hypothetical protein AU14_17525 [Marinobacter similis]